MSVTTIVEVNLASTPEYMTPVNIITLSSTAGIANGATFPRPGATVPDGYEGLFTVTNIEGNDITFTPSITFTPNFTVGTAIDFSVVSETSTTALLDISTVTSNINVSFPVAGEDNDTQGFRDNWSIISTGFTTVGNSVNDLQTVVSALNTRFTNSNVPTSSKGVAGDDFGMIASDGSYLYFCYGAYNGSSNIWARVATTGGTWS
jgi:hypothetical protein